MEEMIAVASTSLMMILAFALVRLRLSLLLAVVTDSLLLSLKQYRNSQSNKPFHAPLLYLTT